MCLTLTNVCLRLLCFYMNMGKVRSLNIMNNWEVFSKILILYKIVSSLCIVFLDLMLICFEFTVTKI